MTKTMKPSDFAVFEGPLIEKLRTLSGEITPREVCLIIAKFNTTRLDSDRMYLLEDGSTGRSIIEGFQRREDRIRRSREKDEHNFEESSTSRGSTFTPPASEPYVVNEISIGSYGFQYPHSRSHSRTSSPSRYTTPSYQTPDSIQRSETRTPVPLYISTEPTNSRATSDAQTPSTGHNQEGSMFSTSDGTQRSQREYRCSDRFSSPRIVRETTLGSRYTWDVSSVDGDRRRPSCYRTRSSGSFQSPAAYQTSSRRRKTPLKESTTYYAPGPSVGATECYAHGIMLPNYRERMRSVSPRPVDYR